jgi:glycosyltransferase involved in cell wall biosynthesis
VEAVTEWERTAVREARAVLVVTPAMRDYVAGTYGRTSGVMVCPNGTVEREETAVFAETLHLVYAGNFAAYENVTAFLQAAQQAADERTRFVLLGDGAQRNELLDYVNRHQVDVAYLGRKRYANVFGVLAKMQVGVLAQVGGTPLTGSPLKVLDYASCGLPVLAGPGAWAEPLGRYGCGIVVEAASGQAFARGLDAFRDRERWERMSRNAKRMVREEFLWRHTLQPLREYYLAG